MLRIIQNTSAAGAKNYYTSASMAEYYTEGQELTGIWRGEGAARLGLSGAVQKEAWDALCDNRHPVTGEALTPRRKQERRVGYDFNFHVPKSLSLLYGLTQDDRILEAFRASVDETMRMIESEIKTRVRKGGKSEDRISGNMVWGEFIHTTARPINGIPDPHLHAHCFIFNATFDNAENRWKAAQIGDIKRDAPYFEAAFHSFISRRLAELGIPIERTRKGWEVAGVDKSTLAKFSRRTTKIQKTLVELEAKAEQKWQEAMAKGEKVEKKTINKYELGATTREPKQTNLTMNKLRKVWRSQLSGDERSGLSQIAECVGGTPIPENIRGAKEAALLATAHIFERKSVVAERELLAQALKRSVGLASVQVTEQAIRDQNLIVAERGGRRLVTTHDVLNEEQRMTEFARRGRGTCPRLGEGVHEFREPKLNDGQRRAVLHVLNSTDRVIIVRGSAGVGKTTALREAVDAIEANGKQVFTFAPSADASRGTLREEGFRNADTVARLLVDEKMQEQVKGNVILVDEAGLLGTRAMSRVFDLADKKNARVVLVGDRFQNGSIERGAALRLLETEAGLIPASIKDIQRQKGAYKQVVQALSEGRTQDGFRQLDDELGWVREVNDADRYKLLAADYVSAVKSKKSALVVCPTHREGERITDEIRSELKRVGKLGKDQREAGVLKNANLTLAERQDFVNYNRGDVLVFNQNARGYTKGQRIIVGDEPLPLDQAARFQVFHRTTMDVAAGDLIRVTQNGKTGGRVEHRINNGSTYSIRGFTKAGDIRLTNGWTVKKDFGHLSQGYCVTSYAAQSRTVDRVFIGQSSMSEPAASREAFYVAISRGRERVVIYTDQKEALRMAIEKTDDRLSATELVSSRERRERGVSLQRMERQAEVAKHPIQEREELIYGR
jgi:conjugative relaxase-like TrwC/TraI family protein